MITEILAANISKRMVTFCRMLTILFVFSFPFTIRGQSKDTTISSINFDRGAVAMLVDLNTVTIKAGPTAATGILIEGLSAERPSFCYINGDSSGVIQDGSKSYLSIEVDEKGQLVFLSGGDGGGRLFHISERRNGSIRLLPIPLWLSLVPPLVAIFLALLVKEVIVSLFAGIWAGAFIAGGMRLDSVYYFLVSLLEPVQKYMVSALADEGHLSIIVFSLLIGGMVALISRNGGMAGVVNRLSKYAKTEKSTQIITWLLGIAIFFDDYANTLIVGNTMRPVTDKFRISREKLAYIVDSTAAPVAAIAFITTWIGAELGFIESGMRKLSGFEYDVSAYGIFLSSLKYSFYPFLTLFFIFIIIQSGKDYGPMLLAERNARRGTNTKQGKTQDGGSIETEDLSPVSKAPLKSRFAVIPVMAVILMTIFGLLSTGMQSTYEELLDLGITPAHAGWSEIWHLLPALWEGEHPNIFVKVGKIIGNADSYIALLWASFTGAALALIMTMSSRIMGMVDSIHTLTTGFKAMLPAIIILTLAWSLAITTDELHTADFLIGTLEGKFDPYLFPPLVFLLSAFISFSTGSSWGTMTILYPIAIPTSWAISTAAGLPPEASFEILLNVISVVLAASVLGDHCSPISDTTILSSLASDCSHIQHVRTQLPYALTVGFVSLAGSWISTRMGGGWLISLLFFVVAAGILYLIVNFFGRKINHSYD